MVRDIFNLSVKDFWMPVQSRTELVLAVERTLTEWFLSAGWITDAVPDSIRVQSELLSAVVEVEQRGLSSLG